MEENKHTSCRNIKFYKIFLVLDQFCLLVILLFLFLILSQDLTLQTSLEGRYFFRFLVLEGKRILLIIFLVLGGKMNFIDHFQIWRENEFHFLEGKWIYCSFSVLEGKWIPLIIFQFWREFISNRLFFVFWREKYIWLTIFYTFTYL